MTRLRGKNADNFGQYICEKLGFGRSAFRYVGNKKRYKKKFGTQNHDEYTDACDLSFSVAGAKCDDTQE